MRNSEFNLEENVERKEAFIIAVIFTCSIMLIFLMYIYYLTPISVSAIISINELGRTEQNEIREVNYPWSIFKSNFSEKALSYGTVSLYEESVSIQRSLKHTTIDNIYIPINYTKLFFPEIEYQIYGFVDSNGTLEYRVLMEKQEATEIVYGLVKASLALNGTKISIEASANDFVEYEKEPFGVLTLVDAPVKSTQNMEKVYGKTGIYKISNEEGIKYICYGNYAGEASQFYLADTKGNPINGALPLAVKNSGAEIPSLR